MPKFIDRIKKSWNVFFNKDYSQTNVGQQDRYPPSRNNILVTNARSIVNVIYNRIAVDCSLVTINHVIIDRDNARFSSIIYDELNEALTTSANVDQTGAAMIQDAVMSMLDEGVVALVPTVNDSNIYKSNNFKIYSIRTGKITAWMPYHVKVEVYNEETGRKQELVLPKSVVCIIENPFYSIMNEPNSTYKRLIRTLNQLDSINETTSSGKLDLIIQLPYVIKSEARKEQAEKRRKEIEDQLVGSKYGIAYTDGTEHITQINRPVENTLWAQAKDLTAQLFNQLGLTESIINGSGNAEEFMNYYTRTLEPILFRIVSEMERKWLTLEEREQGHAIRYYQSPFKLVPIIQMAEVADKFTRNEIMTSNEVRSIIGMRPSDDPKADILINSNIRYENNGNEEEENTEEDKKDVNTIEKENKNIVDTSK